MANDGAPYVQYVVAFADARLPKPGVRFCHQEGMTDRLKEMIEARVQAVDKSIVTVHVKDSESDYQKLMELREKLSNQDLTFEQLQTQVLNLAGNGQDTAVG